MNNKEDILYKLRNELESLTASFRKIGDKVERKTREIETIENMPNAYFEVTNNLSGFIIDGNGNFSDEMHKLPSININNVGSSENNIVGYATTTGYNAPLIDAFNLLSKDKGMYNGDKSVSIKKQVIGILKEANKAMRKESIVKIFQVDNNGVSLVEATNKITTALSELRKDGIVRGVKPDFKIKGNYWGLDSWFNADGSLAKEFKPESKMDIYQG